MSHKRDRTLGHRSLPLFTECPRALLLAAVVNRFEEGAGGHAGALRGLWYGSVFWPLRTGQNAARIRSTPGARQRRSVGRKSSGQDKAEAALDKAKGSAKEAAGRLTGDAALEAEGKKDKVKGDAKGAKGKVKDLFK
jgi:uncharacterized protein YjbJ (UPF0337 family)